MQSKSIFVSLFYSLIVMGIVGAIFFIWFSHSLIGPIVALIEYLKKSKEQLSSGQTIKPIKFRKSDHFQDLAQHLNETLKLALDSRTHSTTKSKLDDN